MAEAFQPMSRHFPALMVFDAFGVWTLCVKLSKCGQPLDKKWPSAAFDDLSTKRGNEGLGMRLSFFNNSRLVDESAKKDHSVCEGDNFRIKDDVPGNERLPKREQSLGDSSRN